MHFAELIGGLSIDGFQHGVYLPMDTNLPNWIF